MTPNITTDTCDSSHSGSERLSAIATRMSEADLIPKIGVELEFRVIDGGSFFESNEGVRLFPRDVDPKWEAPLATELVRRPVAETMRSIVEVVSVPLEVTDVRSAALDAYEQTSLLAADYGLHVLTSGLAILPPIGGFQVVDNERCAAYVQDYQDDARHLTSTGLHIHGTADDVHLKHEVRDRESHWEALFLAVSAGSPIHNGVVTGKACSRIGNYARIPSVVDIMADSDPEQWHANARGILGLLGQPTTTKDAFGRIHSFTRPSYSHPTSEFRICDIGIHADYNRLSILMFWALHKTVLMEISRGHRSQAFVPQHLRGPARYASARHGLDARIPDPFTGSVVDVRSLFTTFVEFVRPALGILENEMQDEFFRLASEVLSPKGNGNSATHMMRLLTEVRDGQNDAKKWNPFYDVPVSALSPSSASTAEGVLSIDECQRLTVKLIAHAREGSFAIESQQRVDDLERELLSHLEATMAGLQQRDIEQLILAMPTTRYAMAQEIGLLTVPTGWTTYETDVSSTPNRPDQESAR